MKKIALFLLVATILTGCSSAKNTSTNGSATGTNQNPSAKEAQLPAIGATSDLATTAKEMIARKEDPFKVLEVYKKMILVYPVNSKERESTLRYILDTSLAMVNDKKGQEALKLSLELDKVIPKDFYIQNRIIGAYRVLAEEQIAKRNYTGAMDLITKGLQVRFDIDIMHTKLNLLILMAQDDIKNKKIDSAKKELNEVLYTIDAQDSQSEKDIFAKEKTEASKILATLQ
ncbi:MAG: hypothetical protein NTX63_00235 [Candidatus Peregrinibacteria bacterium]|nr:hypothetical protein [Candidatus Peregrinibacteria bacterium]